MTTTVILIGLAYLVGSIPFSFLVARTCGVDLRQIGSGNIGAANVWRSCGFRPFLAAITLDFLKGALLPLVAIHSLGLTPVAVILIGAGAMLGHTFPLFLRFKGGKAVATSGGVLLAIFPLAVLVGVLTWAVTLRMVRISSVASLTAATMVVIVALVTLARGSIAPAYAFFICAAAALVFVLHRSNIQRLLAGEENRFQRLW